MGCGQAKEATAQTVINSLLTIPPPSCTDEKDLIAWKSVNDGTFSSAQAYKSLIPVNNLNSNSVIPLIWRWKGPERIKLLLCKIAKGILMANVKRKQRAMTDNDLCPICKLVPLNIASCLQRLWMCYADLEILLVG